MTKKTTSWAVVGAVFGLICVALGVTAGWNQKERSTRSHHHKHSLFQLWGDDSGAENRHAEPIPVSKVYHWGYIDKTGKFVIPPKFENAFEFQNGLGSVDEKDANRRFDIETFIDKSGHTTIVTLATMQARHKAGLPNPQDVATHAKVQDDLKEFFVKKQYPWREGFSDNRGRIIIKPVYESVREFHEGLSLVSLNSRQQYIDKHGRSAIVLPSNYKNCGDFSEGLACVALGGKGKFGIGAKWGFIDTSGRLVIPAKYETVDLSEPPIFVQGLAKVCIEENQIRKFGFINHSGKFVIKPIFNDARRFSEGLAAVSVGPLGFDADEWNSNENSHARIDMADKFFRTYSVVGMPMLEVRRLLGNSLEQCEVPADRRLNGCTYDSFRQTRFRCGCSDLHFEYRDRKVTRYCESVTHRFGPWTSDNHHPQVAPELF